MIESDAVIDDFDDLSVEGPSGGTDAIIAVSTRFFFDHGETKAARLRAIAGIKSYCDVFLSHLSHYVTHDGDLRSFNLDEALEYFASVADLNDPDQHTLYLSVVGFPGGKAEHGPLSMESRLSAAMPYWTQFERYSEWAATTPFQVLKPNYHKTLLEHVLKWAPIVRPRHGSAGPTLVVDNTGNHQRAGQTIFPLLKRFPGLDYDDAGNWITECGLNNKIRAINWLTILDDEFVEMLGGTETVAKTVGDACVVVPYDGGIVIQAGSEPVLGDVNRAIVPAAYKAVAALTKPIRFEDYSLGLLYPREPLDRIAETKKWIERFD